jgi:hypothetical protein
MPDREPVCAESMTEDAGLRPCAVSGRRGDLVAVGPEWEENSVDPVRGVIREGPA